MKKKVNWGIIGLGKIAHKFASDLGLSNSGKLQAVASRSLAKAQNFASEYPAETVYGSYEELLQDPKVDIVYIALPHSQHFTFSSLALQYNKAILCEKPMGLNPEEVLELQKEAIHKNLFIMEGLWTRFIPATQKLLSLLKQNVIGDIISLKADFGFKPRFDPHSRLFDPALGGGSLLDIGLYPLYLSLLVLGEPREVKAFARFSETGVDSHCQMLLKFPSGALAQLESSFETQTPTEATIYGTKGSIKIHSRFHHAEKISLRLNEGASKDFELKFRGHGYIHEIEAVNNSLLNGEIENDTLPHLESQQLARLIARVKNLIY